MSWQEPQWSFLGQNVVASTGSADIFSSLRAQITGSSLYWHVVSSSNPDEALVITPAGANTPSSGTLHIVLTTGITGSSGYAAPDLNTNNSTRLQVGLTPDSGTFETHQSDRPFGASHRWSQYWHCATISTISATFIVESEESILLGFTNTAGNRYGVLAGAILESFESGTGERVDATTNTGRMYGMIVGGQGTWSTNFWVSHTFSSHLNINGAPHSGIFAVSGGIPNNGWLTMSRHGKLTTAANALVTADGTRVGAPMSYYNAETVREEALGRSRGFFCTGDAKGLTTYFSGGTAMAYAVATDDQRSSSTVSNLLFAPASGASGFL